MRDGTVNHAVPHGPPVAPPDRDDLTRALAERVAEIGSERLPQDVAERARMVLLDTLGAILAGAVYSRPTQVARDCIVDLHAGTSATVLGHGIRASSVGAALCNGIAAHALELDDSHRYATGYHPGATVVPAALAIAEQEDRSIDALVAAIAAGYEAGGRIGRAVNPSHRYRGFHSTGTVGVFGAAAAARSALIPRHRLCRLPHCFAPNTKRASRHASATPLRPMRLVLTRQRSLAASIARLPCKLSSASA